MDINIKDIFDLISLGRTINNPDEELIQSFKQRDCINRQSGETWRKILDEITDNNLILVFKALVILERELKWCGGSVAGAIWVYDVIRHRKLDNENEIADFALRNCENPWIPFGSSYYGPRTMIDYCHQQREKTRISKIKTEYYEKVLKRTKGRKERRIAAIAELRKLTYEQRGKILSELLIKHEKSPIIKRLEIISEDKKYPPEYYPKEWILLTNEEIKNLPIELIKSLYDKLSTKSRGEWKRFAKKLAKYDDGI